MRILIVEDEIKIRHGMANLIEKHTEHHVVGEARNGREGLEMILRENPDLVISDIRMPVMDGLKMLEELHKREISQHCVILSGYSEFDYAKQAIHYGVDDYLIKPLAPEDVIRLLLEVQKKIEKELQMVPITPQKRLREILLEKNETDAHTAEIQELCQLSGERGCRLLTAYMGKGIDDHRTFCLERFQKLEKRFCQQKIYSFFLENTREFVCIMEDANWELIKEELEKKLLGNALHKANWIWTETYIRGLKELGEAYEKVGELYSYGMVLDGGRFFNRERILGYKAEDYSYPRKIEHEIQKAILSGYKEELHNLGEGFMEHMKGSRALPARIREGYIRMADFIMNVVRENDKKIYTQLESLNLVTEISKAITKEELEELLREELRVIELGMEHKEDIGNFTIRCAMNYIRNYYQEGISLEAVADSLDITPEYLSTLFNREMGVNFSTFIKKFRMSHAKRLLKGTDKKIYEIARETGYADPKYFNRVFKEEEGISPGDYRSLR